ncbi:hypothetical protein [Aliarcobacter butzleri]|uniref:hypothetical protein n=1 Tax=Aliarcobacter butzleri TaxID=28197 RepID=UPI0021B2F9A6|nr:hypothetical protein [Aliarcobacter butzleri]MCT7591500.1 hypothetical protein [Aliarcobacter butzleri]MCT7633317.1 hypothetical protein [Aliarcobacter butzleri]MDN5061844.1 hypothetical protein [Aliarcobacter butzleri]
MELCYSIEEYSNETILEKILVGEKRNLDVLASADKNKQFKEIYGIELVPKSLNDGIFGTVIYEESDNSLYLLEINFPNTTYEKALERLESLKNNGSNGFVVKLIPVRDYLDNFEQSI